MPKIAPFRAVRPHRDKAHLVGSRSYLSYSGKDLEDKLEGNPFTFLHVLRPEMHAGERLKVDRLARYQLVNDEYKSFFDKDILQKEAEPSFYIYRQTKGPQTFKGIIAGVAVEEYLEGHVKIHEQTITFRERIFQEYLEITGFNAEPVLLTYEGREAIDTLVDSIVAERPEYEFYTTDKVKHELWVVGDKEIQQRLIDEMALVPDVYIADGHHRCASSALLSGMKGHGQSQPFNRFMSLLMPSSELKIYEYNRLVKELNGLSAQEFISALKESFEVSAAGGPVQAKGFHHLTMYLGGEWYDLHVKKDKVGNDPVSKLDTRILTNQVLRPILGIEDIRTDKRISFIDGLQGIEGIQRAVDSGRYAVGFSLFPVTFEQLKTVSDCGAIMPPKSTWIEPKLRTGLTIYELFED
jgi:uncharacterized protein (DUF1015 family)